MLDSFRTTSRLKREAVPSDALAMYRAWKHAVDVQRAARKINLGDYFYYGTPPLDFDAAAQAVTAGAPRPGDGGVAGSMAAFNANSCRSLERTTVTVSSARGWLRSSTGGTHRHARDQEGA